MTSPDVRMMRKKYTRVVKIGEAWNTYLQIDHQGFCVVEQTTRQRANWFGKMLAVALVRLVGDSQTEFEAEKARQLAAVKEWESRRHVDSSQGVD